MATADEPLPASEKGPGASDPRGLWLCRLLATKNLEIAYRCVAKRLEPGPLRRWQSNRGRRKVTLVWAAGWEGAALPEGRSSDPLPCVGCRTVASSSPSRR